MKFEGLKIHGDVSVLSKHTLLLPNTCSVRDLFSPYKDLPSRGLQDDPK
jgi:hypothetical protein